MGLVIRLGAVRWLRGVTQDHGFTLIEVLTASLIGSVVVGGTMMAYVTAARIATQQNSPQSVEAETLAQQTIEGFRNSIAADIPSPGAGVGTWQADPLPTRAALPGSEQQSIIRTAGGAARVYCVFRRDCDGDGVIDPTKDQCYAIQVKVCWNGTSCPTVGSACP